MALRDRLPSRRPDPVDRAALPPALAAALADLDRLMSRRPELARAGGVLARVLVAAFGTPVPPVSGPHADPELLRAAWRSGVPAFRAGETPPALDPAGLRARAESLCLALGDDNPRAAPLRDAIRSGTVDPREWAVDALEGRSKRLASRTESLGLDPDLARSVLRLALLPVLAAQSATLAAVRTESLWDRGDCPNCGEPPVLAESRGLEQRRIARCGLCAAEWPGDRLRCAFCGETDHRRLSYRYLEGEHDRRRVDLCESCGGRLKVVSTLVPLSAPALIVAELASAHLDSLDGQPIQDPLP